MRAAVNYTAGKYAWFCLKIHQERSDECAAAVVVVVFAKKQGITKPPIHPFSYSTPKPLSPAGETHPALSLLEASRGKIDYDPRCWITSQNNAALLSLRYAAQTSWISWISLHVCPH